MKRKNFLHPDLGCNEGYPLRHDEKHSHRLTRTARLAPPNARTPSMPTPTLTPTSMLTLMSTSTLTNELQLLECGIILKQTGNIGDAERMFIQARFFAPANVKPIVDRYLAK